jgi:glycerophosphoryl diester phosphodiesterase
MAIAHRGASAVMPENTVAAFDEAIRLGAAAVEFDLRLSADGHMIVLHDETLDRTTSGKGPVAQMEKFDLFRLDAGSWMHPRFTGLRIPTLDEALRAIAPAALPVIELKAAVDPHAYIAALDRHGLRDAAVTISFEPDWIAGVKTRHPGAITGLLADQWRGSEIRACQRLRCGVLVLSLDVINLERVEEALDAGLEVWCYTANDIAVIAACAAMGITGIITDRPDLIRPK